MGRQSRRADVSTATCHTTDAHNSLSLSNTHVHVHNSALIVAAYASHVTVCSTTLHSHSMLAPGIHSPLYTQAFLRRSPDAGGTINGAASPQVSGFIAFQFCLAKKANVTRSTLTNLERSLMTPASQSFARRHQGAAAPANMGWKEVAPPPSRSRLRRQPGKRPSSVSLTPLPRRSSTSAHRTRMRTAAGVLSGTCQNVMEVHRAATPAPN